MAPCLNGGIILTMRYEAGDVLINENPGIMHYKYSMTRLTLLRHAKSIWEETDKRDLDRSLNGQGQREATLMGLVCSEHLPPPDLVFLSPAQRTRETVVLFLESWLKANPQVKVEENLYLAEIEDFLEILEKNPGEADHILICSHQPGLGDFASWLCPDFDGRVPPATVISLLVKSGNLEQDSAELDFAGCPEEFQNLSGGSSFRVSEL